MIPFHEFGPIIKYNNLIIKCGRQRYKTQILFETFYKGESHIRRNYVFLVVLWRLLAIHLPLYFGAFIFTYLFTVLLLRQYSVSHMASLYYGTRTTFVESIKYRGYIYKVLVISIIIAFFRVLLRYIISSTGL